MHSRKEHILTKKTLIRRIMVLPLLGGICVLNFPKAALAQDADCAGSTKVKAYVIAASEDVAEKDAEDEEQPQDDSETKVKTGDESQAVKGPPLFFPRCALIRMPIVVERDHFPIIIVDSGSGNRWTTKITTNVWNDSFRGTFARLRMRLQMF